MAPGELPSRLRSATLLAVVLSGLCGLFAAWDGFSLLRFNELRQEKPLFKVAPDPVLAEQVWQSNLLALEQMREPRMVLLLVLALACSLSFVASTRLLRPAGLPREGVRRILVWALVVAAALRTVDGAQETVLARSTAEVLGRGLALPEGTSLAVVERVRGLVAPTAVVVTILRMALVVGTFLLLSQYFRSARVKQWAAAADTQST